MLFSRPSRKDKATAAHLDGAAERTRTRSPYQPLSRKEPAVELDKAEPDLPPFEALSPEGQVHLTRLDAMERLEHGHGLSQADLHRAYRSHKSLQEIMAREQEQTRREEEQAKQEAERARQERPRDPKYRLSPFEVGSLLRPPVERYNRQGGGIVHRGKPTVVHVPPRPSRSGTRE